MSDETVPTFDVEDELNGRSLHFTWRGILLGPGIIKHEPLTGRDGHPGLQVLRCAICGRPGWRGPQASQPLGIRIMEQLVRPGWTDEWRNDAGHAVAAIHEPAAVVGWITSCKHVVWAGEWELVHPGPNRIARWEDLMVPRATRDKIRHAAFARGEE